MSELKRHFKVHGVRLVNELRSYLNIYIRVNQEALLNSLGRSFDARISPVFDNLPVIPSHPFLENPTLVSLDTFSPLNPKMSIFENGSGNRGSLFDIATHATEQGHFDLINAYADWFDYYGPLLARALGKENVKVSPELAEAYKSNALNFFSHTGKMFFSVFKNLAKIISPVIFLEVALVFMFSPNGMRKIMSRFMSNSVNNKKGSFNRVAYLYRLAKALEDEEKKEIYDRWHGLINMTQKELDDWGDNPNRLKASLNRQKAKESGGIQSGYDSFRRIVRRKSKPFKDWSDKDFQNAQQEINFNTRMLGNNPGQPINKDTLMSKWEISLLNWGHDPSKKNSPSYGKWKSWKDEHDD